MTNTKILIVDDDMGMRLQLKWSLPEYEVISADSRIHAMELFNLHQPPLVTLDLGLPPDADGTTEGFATLEAILKKAPHTKVVIVSGAEATTNAEKAKSQGAYDYNPKPLEIARLKELIKKAFDDYQSDSDDSRNT